MLDIDYEWREVDILAGETHTPQFLSMNPNGKIPLLVLPDGRCLSESNAILCYLAADTALIGSDRYTKADVLRWMFFEQYSHEPNIATSRFIMLYLGHPAEKQNTLAEKRTAGYKALDVMENQLKNTAFFAGDTVSVADITLYAYTHVADEGGFSLEAYPAVRDWLARIEALPGYVSMQVPATD